MNNIPKFRGDDEQLLNELNHMLTRVNMSLTDKSVIQAAIDYIEFDDVDFDYHFH